MPRIDAACAGARRAESDGNGGGGNLGISLTINARLPGFGTSIVDASAADGGRRSSASQAST
ncbi:hypothetical protein [Burkholderia mayonis]|uniref:hypothetical protein n=1 Tax=Burkholderia mayonis TaxID=1385591 RepID=UPI001396CE21|nr:hypothetical protein [Burkholderia mayonis]